MPLLLDLNRHDMSQTPEHQNAWRTDTPTILLHLNLHRLHTRLARDLRCLLDTLKRTANSDTHHTTEGSRWNGGKEGKKTVLRHSE
jgi:hypothetical protein